MNRCNSSHLNNPSIILLCTNGLLDSASDQYDEELALRFFFHIFRICAQSPASLLEENAHLRRSAFTQSFHSLTCLHPILSFINGFL